MSQHQVDDPVFAMIEAHREAALVYEEKVEVAGKLSEDGPAKIAADAETDRAAAEMFGLAKTFLDIAPTSSAGAVAVLSYVGTLGRGDWSLPECAGDVGGEKVEDFAHAPMRHVASALARQVH